MRFVLDLHDHGKEKRLVILFLLSRKRWKWNLPNQCSWPAHREKCIDLVNNVKVSKKQDQKVLEGQPNPVSQG